MADRRRLGALFVSMVLVSATLGGVAGAAITRDATLMTDISRVFAAVTPGSQKLHFSGVLTENDAPVQKGNQKLRFSIWTDASSTDVTLKKWEEEQTVNVRNGGAFSAFLGSTTPFPEGVFENPDLYLGIDLLDATTNAVVTTFPRQELASVPRAFRAAAASKADNLDDTKCAKCVKEGHVQDKVIGHEKIKDNAVRKDQIDNKAVAREKIDDKAVSKEKIEDKAVGREKIEDQAVGKGQLADAAVGKKKLEAGAELDGKPGYSITDLAMDVGGGFRSIATTIGVDGLPVIAFFGQGGVSLAKCKDLGCTSATINDVPGFGSGQIGIAIGPSGNPLLASGSGELAKCDDPECASATIESAPIGGSAIAVDTFGEVLGVSGDDEDIAIGGHGGTVRILAGDDVVAHILPGAGSPGVGPVVLDPAGGGNVSMAINADGGPIVVYLGNTGGLRFAQCDDPLCSSRSTGIVDEEPGGMAAGSVAIGRDGRPVIAYTKRIGSSGPHTLFVAHCGTPNCSRLSSTLAISDPLPGIPVEGVSITIGTDGLPLVAFVSLSKLSVLHCSNVFCVPHARAR
jgi:hypothetical protein